MKTLNRISLVLAVALGLPLGGCSIDDLLRISSPNAIDPGKLDNASGAAALRAGAIADFAFAIDGDGGGTEGQSLVSGLLADEWRNSDTFGTRQEIDQRAMELANGTLTGVFRSIQAARLSAERATAALLATSADTTNDPRIAEMRTLAGFTYVTIGENYCSGVPLPAEGQTDAPPVATAAILNQGIARFDAALNNFAGDNSRLWGAQVGKARALLDLGQFANAGALVATVPDAFTLQIEHSISTHREQNGVYVFNALSARWSISDLEGGTGLPFLTANDPRLRYLASGVGFDGATPLFISLRYTDFSDPTPLATGTEARLIEAEAALQAADYTTWLAKLNGLRTAAGMSTLADPGATPDTAARTNLTFRERGFWLFVTGHRLSDLRRLVRQYGLAVETVFPTGTYMKGGTYGTDVNIPVPTDEQNNPSFKGCIDRNP